MNKPGALYFRMNDQTLIFWIGGALAIVWFVGIWTGWVSPEELLADEDD